MSSSPKVEDSVRRASECESTDGDTSHDPHFDPIITLPEVEVPTHEEEEEELVKVRARLYRYDTQDHEWKERGTGDIKLLHHKQTNNVRVVMRRDKTLKVCANHFITPDIRMNVHCGSDRAFNWSVFADFADETCRQELLAIKFGNPHNAQLWKTKFAEAQEIVRTKCDLYRDLTSDEDDANDVSSDDDVTPERSEEKSATESINKSSAEKSKEEEVVLQLKDLKVENEASE